MDRPTVTRERSVALFILGALLFNPPLIAIFGAESVVFGVPLLFLYLFAAWAGVIALVAATAERSAPPGGVPPRQRLAANDGDGA